MFESIKAKVVFDKLLGRPDINKAYEMVGPDDSWYETIKKVHESYDELRKNPSETLSIVAHDNVTLKAIYYKNSEKDAPTVIFAHGFTSHPEREWAFPGLFYRSLGFNVVILYQRAHGISGGNYISMGALEHLDLMKWVEKINEITPNSQIVLHGLSMGASVVLDASLNEMKNVKCVIADAPSPSIESFFTNVCNHIFKEKGEKVCNLMIKRFNKEFNCDIKNFDRIANMAKCKYPTFLSMGSLEPFGDMFSYMKTLNPNDTEILILDGCNHGNGMYKKTELYQNTLKEFINKYVK